MLGADIRARHDGVKSRMYRAPIVRSRLIPLLLVAVLVGLSACSSGSSDKSSSDSTGGVSQKTYCASVQALVDLTQGATGSSLPADQQAQVTDELAKAAAAAPAEVHDDFLRSLGGDSYARDNVDQYNKKNCGIDTTS